MATLGQYEYVEIVTWPEAFRKRKQNKLIIHLHPRYDFSCFIWLSLAGK